VKVEIRQEPVTSLEEYANIPIAFVVNSILDVETLRGGEREFRLTERRIDIPYVKDYDSIEGEGPASWPARFDLLNWAFILARSEGHVIGGAALAFAAPELDIVEGGADLAILWDLRVSPGARRQGVGASLFRAAESRAKAQGCRELQVETQNINVAACRFYARQGCELRGVNFKAYAGFPDEIQLLWYKIL
jgi:GNAT superfamily N-acetyltransferase